MVPIATQALSLKEFMKLILGLSEAERQSPNLVKILKRTTGMSGSSIGNYLEKLDLKYLKIDWSNTEKPRVVEVLQYTLDELSDETPRWASAAQGAIGVCCKCRHEKRIVAKGLCWHCYNQERMEKLPLGECVSCKTEQKIYAEGLCLKCYREKAKNPDETPILQPPPPINDYLCDDCREIEEMGKLLEQLSQKIDQLRIRHQHSS